MSEEPKLTFSWQQERDSDISPQEFASKLLNHAQELLARDGSLASAAFLITEREIHCYEVSFKDHEQKRKIYDELIVLARLENAVAVVTLNDAYTTWDATPEELKKYENYYPGLLQKEKCPECIFMTITGPGLLNETLTIPYLHVEGEICFGELKDETGGEVGLLEGWAEKSTKKQ